MRPKHRIALIGQTVKYTCYSNKPKRWTFENGALPQNVRKEGLLNKFIDIQGVQFKNAGIYKCYSMDKKNTSFVAEGRLQVQGKV